MPEALNKGEIQELIHDVGCVRSGVLLASWTIEAMNECDNFPKEKGIRFELHEGLIYFLELLAGRLSNVYQKMNSE